MCLSNVCFLWHVSTWHLKIVERFVGDAFWTLCVRNISRIISYSKYTSALNYNESQNDSGEKLGFAILYLEDFTNNWKLEILYLL